MNAARRALGFARQLAAERGGARVLPRMLTYTVSFACNARCIMCDSWKLSAKGDLTLPEIERILRGLPPMDVVRLTGGEPTLRQDLVDIARLVHTHLRPMVLHLTTNGFSPERLVAFAEQRPRELPLHVLVSIDGLEDVHNRVRGREWGFERSFACLEALAPRRKELRLQLAVNQTVVEERAAEQYEELHRRLAAMEVPHHLIVAYDESATYSVERGRDLAPEDARQYRTFGDLPREVCERLIDAAIEDLEELPFVERAAKRYYLRGLRSRLIDGRAHPQPACVALNSHLRMFPNGDVPTCQFNSRIVGNLARQSFEDVWFGADAREQRDWVRRCQGCWAECEVLPSALYTGDIVRSLVAGA